MIPRRRIDPTLPGRAASGDTPGMTASEELRAHAADLWERQLRHPFITGIGDGTLDIDVFRRWVRQDYLFLIEYGRVLSLCAARAPDLETMRRFAELAHETLATEMDLHRSLCAELGIDEAALEREAPAGTTRAYTDFLVRTAAAGDFAEAAAAVLPCMWGFSEIGRRLAERGRPSEPRYAAWVDTYASDEFAELARWCRTVVDRTGEDASPATLEAMREAFRVSSAYELAFWQMPYEAGDA
jgi:thiaminase/transcriptional activator TenA